MRSYCKVRWCRFDYTHSTNGHKCGKCGEYGHGETECNSQYYKDLLKKYHNEVLPDDLHCTVKNCQSKQYHTIDAHHCPNCQLRITHTISDCMAIIPTHIISYDVKCPICRADNHITKHVKLFGISDKCCVCMESVVDVLLPDCGHCCVCLKCLPMLPK
jgi:hypothetical protein